jgi:TPR repeat protein
MGWQNMILDKKCKNCGGSLEQTENEIKCLNCSAIPKEHKYIHVNDPYDLSMQGVIDEIRLLRQEGEFYKVVGRIKEVEKDVRYVKYRKNLRSLYWQAILNENRIVYVLSKSGDKQIILPTFFEMKERAIRDNVYYNKLISICHELGDTRSLGAINIYENNIDQLEQFKKLFIDLRQKEKHDLFISFKHLDENKQKTTDFYLAKRIYKKLCEMGKSPFFSEETLKTVAGDDYEPHIYNALYASQVMILICTQNDYIESEWVKNEWERFLHLSKLNHNKEKKLILILPRGFNTEDLPEPLRINQQSGLERQFFFFDSEEDLCDELIKNKYVIDCDIVDVKNTQENLMRAIECFDQKKYIDAFNRFERLTNLETAQYYLGLMYLNGLGVKQDYQIAFEYLTQASENSDTPAAYLIGFMYEEGFGVTKNIVMAYNWYQKADQKGIKEAQHKLGKIYENGLGVKTDILQAKEYYQKAAEQGLAEAQQRLGYLYERGLEGNFNEQKAIEWYQKAANQGESTAQIRLGSMYESGRGIPVDYQVALDLYQKAASQGNARAYKNIGVLFEFGKGVIQDYHKAKIWYEKAVNQGDKLAYFNLGSLYLFGNGVKKNEIKAKEYYEMAGKNGNMNAQYNLGLMYEIGKGVSQDIEKAIEWYKLAANQGHVKSQYVLGSFFESGNGVPSNDFKAFEYYLSASEKGDMMSQYKVAVMYEHGKGTPQSSKQSKKWYMEAAEQGYPIAQNDLGVIYFREKDYPKAIYWLKKAVENNNSDAQYNFGLMYENGLGLKQDEHQAKYWYQNAAKNGNRAAKEKLRNKNFKQIKVS